MSDHELVQPYHGQPWRGATIILTAKGPMGTLEAMEDSRFASETVRQGAQGRYIGPHHSIEGWHMVAFGTENGIRYAPLADGTFYWTK